MENKILSILKTYWGYDTFRPPQKDIILSILENDTDHLVILPTGGGKSICFQVPALTTNGVCLVISPLIALIKDQVLQLKKRGITATAIHSGMSSTDIQRTISYALSGHLKFLYVSPERLQSKSFQNNLTSLKINFIAIDEAHCISQWGHDFRPAYLQIKILKQFFPQAHFIALTASATQEVQKDICTQLEFKHFNVFKSSYSRPELSYNNIFTNEKINKLIHILKKNIGTSIVYCNTRKKCEETSNILKAQGINADYYHAGLENEIRHKRQEAWLNDKLSCMICTNAFGMGIDKANVRLVVHYESPNCIESFYQEAGRAGRDRQKAYSILLFNNKDFEFINQKLILKYPDISLIKKVYFILNNFYKIALGKGENTMFDFKIENILPLIKEHSSTEIVGAIDILKYENIIDNIDIPNTQTELMICCNRNYFDEFKKNATKNIVNLLEYISRNIENVWHNFVNIKLKDIAQQLKITEQELERLLSILQKVAILEYKIEKAGSKIIFLINRISHIEQYIKTKTIEQKKLNAINKLNAIKEFAFNKKCRSQFIAHYFGDESAQTCGICDICRKKKLIQKADFNTIKTEMINLLKEKKQMSYTDFLNASTHHNKSFCKEVIQFLISENQIVYNRQNQVSLKQL